MHGHTNISLWVVMAENTHIYKTTIHPIVPMGHGIFIFLWATTIPTDRTPIPPNGAAGSQKMTGRVLGACGKCRLWSSQKGAFPDVSCKISHVFCGIWNQLPESDGFPEWFDQCQTWWEAHPLTFAIFFSRWYQVFDQPGCFPSCWIFRVPTCLQTSIGNIHLHEMRLRRLRNMQEKNTTSIVAIQYPLPMQFSDRIKPDSVLNAPW